MYKVYESWCKENKEYTLSSIKFAKKMTEKGFEKGRTKYNLFWKGIGLLDKERQSEMEECTDNYNPFVKD